MSGSLVDRHCDLCAQMKPCTSVSFHPVSGDRAAPSPYTGTMGLPVENQFYLSCCEDCGREKGTVSKTPWILILIGYVLFFGTIVMMATQGLSDVWPVVPLMTGWALTVFAPMALIFKMRNEWSNAAMITQVVLQFFPVVGLIALLVNVRNYNRTSRAFSALKTIATERMLQDRQKDEEMTRLAESGESLTEEQKKQVEEHMKDKEIREKIEECAREEQQEKVNRSNYRGAIIGIIITVILAVVGISTYSSGSGYMTFFGMELSPGGFAALIAAFLVWDVLSIVSAKKKL